MEINKIGVVFADIILGHFLWKLGPLFQLNSTNLIKYKKQLKMLKKLLSYLALFNIVMIYCHDFCEKLQISAGFLQRKLSVKKKYNKQPKRSDWYWNGKEINWSIFVERGDFCDNF